MTQWAIKCPVNVNVKAGKVAISLFLSSELDGLVGITKLLQETLRASSVCGPDYKYVFHIMKPAEGLEDHFIHAFSSEVVGESSGNIGTPLIFL